MGVRVSGFRKARSVNFNYPVILTDSGHSWSPVFGRSNPRTGANNGDILISTLGLVDATVLPNFTSLPGDIFEPRAKDLNSIIVVSNNYVKGPKLSSGKKYVRLGTSTTNEQLRRWCIDIGNVTLPMNIIEVEITQGGSNAMIWYANPMCYDSKANSCFQPRSRHQQSHALRSGPWHGIRGRQRHPPQDRHVYP